MKPLPIFTRGNVGVFVLSVVLFVTLFFWLGLPIPKDLQSVELVVFYYVVLSFLFGYLTRRYITLSTVPAFTLVMLVPLVSYGIILLKDLFLGNGLRFEKPSFGITVIIIQLIFVLFGTYISQLRLRNVSRG
jgi:hypothetical protein